VVSAKRGAAIVVVVGALAGLTWWVFPTDARKIRRASQELAALVSVPAGESEIARLARASRLGQRLAEDFVAEVAEEPAWSADRDTVVSYVARLSGAAGGTTVTLDDLDVEVTAGGHAATARAVATVREPDPRGGPDRLERREVSIAWQQREGRWRPVRATLGLARLGES
jgi:ketosteroid isomerase-like protein